MLKFSQKLMLTLYTLDISMIQSSSLFPTKYFVYKSHIWYKCNLWGMDTLLG